MENVGEPTQDGLNGFEYLFGIKTNNTLRGCCLSLVEMAVFETASENSFSQLSTSVADILNLSVSTPVGRLTSGQFRYA